MFVAEAGCLYLFRADVQPPPEKENARMRRGKSIHAEIERGLLEVAWSGRAAPEVASAVKWARDRFEGRAIWVEQAIGIDPATGEAQLYDSKDAIPQTFVAVVVDLAGDEGERWSSWDWKTGSQFSTFDYAPQVRLNGYAVAAARGADQIEAGLVYPNADGVAVKAWLLDEFDLAHQRKKLRVWSEQAPTAEPKPCLACRYCPARTICPAMVKGAS